MKQSWEVVFYKGSSAGRYVWLLISLVILGIGGLLTNQFGDWGHLLKEYSWAPVLVVMALMLMTTFSKSRKGAVELDGDSFTLEDGKDSRKMAISHVVPSLGRHFASKSYSYFIGSVLQLKDKASGESWRILGQGAEFPEASYSREDSYGAEYDCYMTSEGLRELRHALSKAGVCEVNVADEPAPEEFDTSREHRFNAFPVKGAVLKPILLWIGGIFGVSVLSMAIPTLFDEQAAAQVAPYVTVGMMVLFMVLLVRMLRKQQRRKGVMVFVGNELRWEVNGKCRHCFNLPLSSVEALTYRVRSRYASHYGGPALRITQGGKKVVVAISDVTVQWPKPDGKTSSVDYTIAADAGRGLLQFLSGHGQLDERFFLEELD